MLDDLEIVNRAMARIGAETLDDLTDETIGGRAVDLVFTSVIEFVLDIYTFSFSKKMVELSELANETPLTGYEHVYQLPAERLGPPIRVTDTITNPNWRYWQYQLQEDTVHSNEKPLYAEIKFRPAAHLWSGAFRDAVVLAMAAECALTIAHDDKLRRALRQDAFGPPQEMYRGGALGSAIRADAFSTPPRPTAWGDNPLTRSHGS